MVFTETGWCQLNVVCWATYDTTVRRDTRYDYTTTRLTTTWHTTIKHMNIMLSCVRNVADSIKCRFDTCRIGSTAECQIVTCKYVIVSKEYRAQLLFNVDFNHYFYYLFQFIIWIKEKKIGERRVLTVSVRLVHKKGDVEWPTIN